MWGISILAVGCTRVFFTRKAGFSRSTTSPKALRRTQVASPPFLNLFRIFFLSSLSLSYLLISSFLIHFFFPSGFRGFYFLLIFIVVSTDNGFADYHTQTLRPRSPITYSHSDYIFSSALRSIAATRRTLHSANARVHIHTASRTELPELNPSSQVVPSRVSTRTSANSPSPHLHQIHTEVRPRFLPGVTLRLTTYDFFLPFFFYFILTLQTQTYADTDLPVSDTHGETPTLPDTDLTTLLQRKID